MKRKRAYLRYKPSGVEWLGDVPEHWDVKKLRYLCSIQTGDKDTVDAIDDGIYPFFVRSQTIERLNSFTFDCEAVLTAGDGVGVGKVFHYVNGKFDFHQRVYMFNNFRKISGIYFFYFLRENFAKVAFDGGAKSTVDSLRMPMIANFAFTVPSLPEQIAIVAFLDRETGRIDTLLEKKERLIELLREKRSVLINHAVTKGIDPSVKLKHSGVKWIGDVPEHWEVKRVKHLGTIRYGLGEPPEYVDEGLPFIRATDIKQGKIDMDLVKKVKPEDVPWSRRPELKLDEILVVRSGAYTGDSALVTGAAVDCIAGYDMVFTAYNAHAPFVALVLLSKYMLFGQIYLERSRAAQPHLNAEELGNLVILVPPFPEQQSIATFLDRETGKIYALITKVEDAIAKLKEYRTALISAAVTGKIDVREAA
jgi:type I restriction enzyme S subunit